MNSDNMERLNFFTLMWLFRSNNTPVFVPTDECKQSQIVMRDYYTPMIYFAIAYYIFICFLTERRSFLRGQVQTPKHPNQRLSMSTRIVNYFKRYPGLPIPMNMLQYRHSTLAYAAEYVCAFNVIAGIFTKIYGMAMVFPEAPVWLSMIYKIFAICLVALTALPPFLCITHGGLICWIVGIFYCGFQAVLTVVSLIRSTCMGLEFMTQKLALQLPTLIGFTYLLVYFCEAVWSQSKNLRNVVWIGIPINFKTYIHKNVSHVRKLLWPKETYQKRVIDARLVKVRCCANLRTLWRNVNSESDGFTYPAGLIWSLAVSVLLQHFLLTQFLNFVYGVFRNGKRSIQAQYPDVPETIYENLAVENARRVHQYIGTNVTDSIVLRMMEFELLYYWIDVLWVCLVVATSLAMFTNVTNVFRIAVHYNQLCVSIYQHGFKIMPQLQSWLDAFKVTRGTIIYPSYQVSAMACGFYLQALIYTFIFLILALVVSLNAFTPFDFFVKWIKISWPSLLLMTAFVTAQQMAIRFLFTQHRGKTYGFDNIRALQIYTFLSSFYNVFFGVVSGVGRTLYCPISSALVISRLDVSPLARPIQSLDTGHLAFLGFLYMDVLKNNPTFRVFLWILLERYKTAGDSHFESTLLAEVNQFFAAIRKPDCLLSAKFHQEPRAATNSLEQETKSMVPKSDENLESLAYKSLAYDAKRQRSRSRWFLAYTLIKNPDLMKYRKTCPDRKSDWSTALIFEKLGGG
ncbi:hypothetical protein CRM22_004827 [Opisthorchis felineus]|uniref:Receptor for retinol uptake STRA6 n=1 Tax=Opisthorchis felineus TaxID=147828 RepID=A0A4S2M0L8_OPIFE|nr:hypothetical protein CRM22_004827 [Opisthorchis felineus]